MENNRYFYENVPLRNSVSFSFVAVFRESTEYVKNYTLPFNMLGVTARAEGERSSVLTNLLTGEENDSQLYEIHLIPSGLPQRYAHTIRNEHYCIHFKLELYPGLDVFSGQKKMFVFHSKELTEEIKRIFTVPDHLLKLSLCQEFALRICHRFWPESYPFDMKRMEPYDPVLQYIRNSADALTSIEDLADILHCNAGTFTRNFHEVFRQSPKQFLQQELFRKAAQLLAAPGESVKTVSEKLKFSSEFYFSRFFKRVSGIPPRDYRNRLDLK